MNAKALKATLATVTEDNFPDSLWEELPEMVAGRAWKEEVIACAESLAEYIYDSEEVDEDQVRDWQYDYSSRALEDYYAVINDRVQALGLWAYPDLDEEVAEFNEGARTLNKLNALYLGVALRGLFATVARWAIDNTEEGEE